MTDDKNRRGTASAPSPKAARSAAREPTAARCPICGKPTAAAFRPFCSKRCADVDLQRWLTGRYAIPVVEDDAGLDESADDDQA
jgi:endogenous inhibitor of DNA gyrase (YacG/DUF329 family)